MLTVGLISGGYCIFEWFMAHQWHWLGSIVPEHCLLTPSAPGVFSFKTCMSHFSIVSLPHHNSPTNCPRELFKPSKDMASLLVCNEKFKFWVSRFFAGDFRSEVGLGLSDHGYQALSTNRKREMFHSNF